MNRPNVATMGPTVQFEHHGKPVTGRNDETVLELARHHNITIANVCGGRGICKSCIIRFSHGEAPQPTEADQHFFSANKIASGWRRACQCAPTNDCHIRIPARARARPTRAFSEGGDIWIHPQPVVSGYELRIDIADLSDGLSDSERVYSEIDRHHGGRVVIADIELLRALPTLLREHAWNVLAVARDDELIGVLPSNTRMLGVAIDLGTTNIAISLVDLRTGNTLQCTGIENPQHVYGGDIIARLAEIKRDPAKLKEMHIKTIAAINEAVEGLCANAKASPTAIADIVVAGNTVMHHIFAELPTNHLGLSPFTATARATPDFKARDLGLNSAHGAYVHLIHNIAGFVGGDHTAVLLGVRADQENRSVIVIDIGTNTEISLIHEGNITSLSCPSGPAFEGGNIDYGMRAAVGAIEKIWVENDQIRIRTIGGTDPVGLCGSGVLDALAAFSRIGAITSRGQIDMSSTIACTEDDHPALKLTEGEENEVLFSQQDVRNVQLAKGSIRAGIEILLAQASLDKRQVDRIVVAGAFGLYVDVESAVAIGMFPDLPNDRFEQIGNAASMGAKLALMSGTLRQEGTRLAAESHYIEQSGSQEFLRCFMANINLPTNEDKEQEHHE